MFIEYRTIDEKIVEGVVGVEQQMPIFALDIGTRSVVGVIITRTSNGTFVIKDIKIVEHKGRSMLDGQIHDVLAVSNTISQVKQQLEEHNGPLHKVAVAAAGRSLRTRRIKIDTNIEGQPLLRKEDIRAFELSAVQESQKLLINEAKEEDMTHYHCVGYSVVNYFLDDEIIGNLIDQRGKKASVEIIATFLPRVVVDSLISSLSRTDLEMEALTLEPIAAIHVLIPVSMRKLNIAFVDIGAGTSDIAITAEGTVVAYGMVPIAGDEITEAISRLYLLDFHIAEEIKRRISMQKEISFTDILGMEYTLPTEVVIQQIEREIEDLAKQIANKIVELNGKAPQAVMLVGGGSQTPRLTEKIAAILNLPVQRVAVRGADAIQHPVEWPDSTEKGPEMVTPIGIGISSQENPIQYLTFQVNGDMYRLFEMKALTIGDALIAAGVPIKSLFGKPGIAMTVTINGKVKMIPGEHGQLPEILLNDAPALLDTKIKNRDIIIAKPGKNGKDAFLTVEQALSYNDIKPLSIEIEGKPITLKPLVEVNKIDTNLSTIVKDRDSILFYHVQTIEEALIYAGYSTIPYSEKKIPFKIDGEIHNIIHQAKGIYRNNKPIALKDTIHIGDKITFDKEENAYPTIKELLSKGLLPSFTIDVLFNGKKVRVQPKSFQIKMNNKSVTLKTPIEPNSHIEIAGDKQVNIIFSDVFRYVDFDTTNPTSSRYVIQVNGEEADFYTPIQSGDRLSLFWE